MTNFISPEAILTLDQSGNVTGLEGASSGIFTLSNSIVGMGHSRIAQAFNSAAFPNLSIGYCTPFSQLMGQRFNWINSFAVVGVTISQVISTQLPQLQALTPKPDWVIIEIGYNDFAASTTAASVISQYITLLQSILSIGAKVIAVTDLPGGTLTTAQQLQQQIFNSWLVQQSQNYKGLIVVDGYSCVVGNAADGTVGSMLTTLRQTDTIHPSPNGAMNVARELFNALDPIVPKYRPFGGGVTASAQLINNPNCDGNNASGAGGWTAGTGITGTGPNNWNAASSISTTTATTSIVARTASILAATNKSGSLLNAAISLLTNDDTITFEPAPTQHIRFVVASNSLAVTVGYRVSIAANGAGVNTGGIGYVVTTGGSLSSTAAADSATWSTTLGTSFASGSATLSVVPAISIGDTVYLVAEVYGSNTAGALAVYGALSFFTSGFGSLGSAYGGRYKIATYQANPVYMPQSQTIMTQPFVIPATTGIIQPQVIVTGTAVSTGVTPATGTVQIGNVELRKVGS